MIIEAIVNGITLIVKVLAYPFNLILPDTPVALRTAMSGYIDMIFDNLGFVSFFVNVETLRTVSLIAIAIWTLQHTYAFLQWVVKKLPFSID